MRHIGILDQRWLGQPRECPHLGGRCVGRVSELPVDLPEDGVAADPQLGAVSRQVQVVNGRVQTV